MLGRPAVGRRCADVAEPDAEPSHLIPAATAPRSMPGVIVVERGSAVLFDGRDIQLRLGLSAQFGKRRGGDRRAFLAAGAPRKREPAGDQ